MHRAALDALGLRDWSYQRLPVPPEVFAETVLALHGSGFVGANVTIPHKEAALALSTAASARARDIGAANTLVLGPEGAVEADNTDAPGLLAALDQDVRGATALVLGAGGSARAAAYALREAGAARVRVWNRTAQRAREVADDLGVDLAPDVSPADVLVHCTSVGLDGRTSPFKDLPLRADGLDAWPTVVDLVYRPGGTDLLHAARRQGCRTVDGLEILVHQGALSFETWTGRPAPIDVMRDAARGADQH